MAFIEIPLVVTVTGKGATSWPAVWLFVAVLVGLSGYLLWKRSQSF